VDPAQAFAEIARRDTVSRPFVKVSARTKKPLSQKKREEMEMYWDWKNSGEDPEKFQPLLDSFQSLIGKRVRMFQQRTPLPPAAVEAEFNHQFLRALRRYDPGRGTQLSTFVHHYMRSGQRFVNKYQNVGRIPETRSYDIGKFKTAQFELDQQLGREPSTSEMADRLGWNQDEVGRMQAELSHADLPTSGFKDDPTSIIPSKDREMLEFLRFELTPDELTVYEHLLGTGGKKAMSATQIAKKVGWSDSKVSRIRKRIAAKAQRWDPGW